MRYIDDVEVKKPTITIGTHFFKVNDATGNIAQAIARYATQFNQMGFSRERGPNGRPKFEVKARFYTYIPLKNEYRFHIEQLNDLLDYFERAYIGPDDIDIIGKEWTEAPPCVIKMKPSWVLMDYQNEVKGFILNKKQSPSRSRLAALPTGTGKTVIGLATAAELNTRIALPVPAGYTDKWVGDVMEQYDLTIDEILMVGAGPRPEGAEYKKVGVRKAIQLAAEEDCPYKVFVISQETLSSFYREYETAWYDGFEEHWGCHPEDFFKALGVGVAIIDETHEAINMVFRMMTYMNLPLVIGLSGTLISKDPFVEGIQRLMFPASIRYDKVKMKKYIDFRPTAYAFANINTSKIKHMAGNMYSQIVFEQSILANKNKEILKNYLKMIDYFFTKDFVERKKDGEKGAIYASRIEMCEIIVKYLKMKHPELDIRKYTGEDPFDNAVNAEVRVTTRGSCGTAIDIKRLISLITIDNVDSPVGNLQLLGRLRENKFSDTVPLFRQLYCVNIPKHVAYQKSRHSQFSDRVLNIEYERYGQPIDVAENARLEAYA